MKERNVKIFVRIIVTGRGRAGGLLGIKGDLAQACPSMAQQCFDKIELVTNAAPRWKSIKCDVEISESLPANWSLRLS